MDKVTDLLIWIADVFIAGLLVLFMLLFLALTHVFCAMMAGINTVPRLLLWFRKCLYE